MLYCQLSGKRSLRELVCGYNEHTHAHYHLDTGPLKRSTLSDANNKRNVRIYEDLLSTVMRGAPRILRKRTTDAIEILDSTQIKLNEALYEWAAKGHRVYGVKAHIAYNTDSQTPVYFDMSNANVNDVQLLGKIAITKGTLYLFDRGYYNFKAWAHIMQAQATFITRLKRNAAYTVKQHNTLENKSILCDQMIHFTSDKSKTLKGIALRHIVSRDERGRQIELITNRIHDRASQIVALYKQRWQIEVFFKWIKQNLKIKRFIGRSENAVRLQLVIAIIAYILLKIWHQCSCPGKNLQYLAATIKDALMLRIRKDKPPPKRIILPGYRQMDLLM
jgi:hypothetical protein